MARTKAPTEPTCEWTADPAHDAWDGACGAKWQFHDGGPRKNNMRFCPECGRKLKESPR